MADSPILVSSLDGYFKQVYGDDVPNLIPEELSLQEKIKFVPRAKELGNSYNQPVRLANSTGFSFIAPEGGVITLNDAKAMTVKNASVKGSQVILRDQMDYEVSAKAGNNVKAFGDATKYLFEGMQSSHRKMIELEMLYGQDELTTVASYSNPVITCTTAEFSAAMFAGLEGAAVEVFDVTLATNRGTANILSVDLDARTITLDANIAGTTGTDRVFLKDQVEAGGTFASCAGIHRILTNTGSLFGISASTYTLWKGSSYAAGSAALTQAKVGSAIAAAMAKGLMGDVVLYCNPKTWNNLMNDQAALVKHIDRKKVSKPEFVNGAESVTFYHGAGSIEIKSHLFVKEGYAYGLRVKDWIRPGSVDFSMKTPGFGDQIFFHLPTKNAVEVRSYSNQAVMCVSPAKSFVITGIVNS